MRGTAGEIAFLMRSTRLERLTGLKDLHAIGKLEKIDGHEVFEFVLTREKGAPS